MVVVESCESVEGVGVEERLDGALVVRLAPEWYQKIESDCLVGQSVEERVTEIVVS